MADKLYELESNGVTIDQGWQESGKTILTSTQPQWLLDQIVAENKEIKNHGGAGVGKKQGVIGARIPAIMFHNWKKEWKAGPKNWGVSWNSFLAKRINGPDYKHLRFCKL